MSIREQTFNFPKIKDTRIVIVEIGIINATPGVMSAAYGYRTLVFTNTSASITVDSCGFSIYSNANYMIHGGIVIDFSKGDVKSIVYNAIGWEASTFGIMSIYGIH